MKLNHIKIPLFVSLIVVVAIIAVYSTKAAPNSGSFILYLYYNHGSLTESEYEGGIVVSDQNFVALSPKSYKFYTAELYDTGGNLIEKSPVDQLNGLNDGLGQTVLNSTNEGDVTINIPFDIRTAKLVIKNDKGQVVFQQAITDSYYCNYNNICESQFGENSNNCVADCQPSPTYIPVNNTSPSPSTTPVAPRSMWKVFLPLVIWFGLAIAIGVGWFLIKKRNVSNF